MNPEIFRQYDVRGVVDVDLTPPVVERLGRGIGTTILAERGPKVVVGRDCRLSSPMIHDSLVKGLVASGAEVTSVGVCPTPVLYFALHHLAPSGGVMITGSHNPPDYNGFKICIGTEPIYGDRIQDLRRLIEDAAFASDAGDYAEEVIVPAYQSYVRERVSLSASVSLAVDAGNGTGGHVAVPIMRGLGCDVTCLYCDMDGRFPNHHPDPTVEKNLTNLRQAVLDGGLQVGIGYDGDADRLGVIDERGRILWGDKLLALFARSLLERHPGSPVVGEVKCSQVVYDDISAHGGRPIMWKTGHSLIRQKMRETGALLAGEMSGHLFFRDRYLGYDDAIYASLRLLEIISTAKVGLSELLADLPVTYATPEIRVDCADERKFEVVDAVSRSLARDHEVVTVDGVRVRFADGWGLLRASNTQPVLVMRFEALSPKRLDAIEELFQRELAPYGLKVPRGTPKAG
jgi:phosphomannomutase/phosphoglucomutase